MAGNNFTQITRRPEADIHPETEAGQPEVRTTKVVGDSFDHAMLLLGRAHGLLDFMFLASCADGEMEELCPGTMTAVLDTLMAQVHEARELLMDGMVSAREVAA